MQPTPTHIKILEGCAAYLVSERQLVNKYQTNRCIKTWAHYFLLKSLTTSGVIKRWTSQRTFLLEFTQMNENSFRSRLAEMKAAGLCTVSRSSKNINLVSFETAAEILDIVYTGTTQIEYKITTNAKQLFQYQLRAEDIRHNQAAQLEQLIKKVNKNPLLKNQLSILLQQQYGCTEKQLRQHSFFQQKLLQLQIHSFINGSTLYSVIHSLRADLNRGVQKIKEQHGYKSAASVSYMKMVMKKNGIIAVDKKNIDSKNDVRSRKYLPDGKEGYKWMKAKMTTQWVLCDQVTLQYKTILQPPKISPKEKGKENKMKNAA